MLAPTTVLIAFLTAAAQPDRPEQPGLLPPFPPASTTGASSLAGTVELPRLVDLAAVRLGVSIDYDAAALKGAGPVSIRTPEAVTDPDLWATLNRALSARGFTTIRAPEALTFTVVRLQDAPALVTPTPDEQNPDEPLAPGYQSILYRAQFRPGRELAEAAAKILSKPGGSVSTFGDGGGLLLLADLTTRLEPALAMLRMIDTAAELIGIEEVRLTSLTGQQMASMVAQVTARREGTIPGAAGTTPGGAASAAAGPAEVIAGPDPATVLVIAPPKRAAALRQLIVDLDRRPKAETQVYTPRHFAPGEVARLIEQAVRAASASPGPSDDRFRVVADELTGSLIITATPSQHESIRALLRRLDDAPLATRRPVRTFTIKNRPIEEVVSILSELLRSGTLGSGGGAEENRGGARDVPAVNTPAAVFPMPPAPAGAESTSSTQASNPRPSASSTAASPSTASSARAGDEPPVTFTIDKGTSTLIAIGEPRTLDQIAALLKTLDVRQPQVMLEVLLVTLTDGQTMDLGVELEKLEVSGGTLIRLSSLFGLGSRGEGGDRDGPANASGFTGVVLNPGDFSIVLRALETLNQGRAMSMPKLLVGNNEQATLDSVVQQPFASVNASNTVSTTSFGGTQDAGTVVTIQPQIAEGDHLLLQYSVSLSAFLGPATSPTLPPPRQQNRVQSVATIPDGFTVVVGGIEIQNNSQTVSQIPLLGSIPIIGEAFKSRSNAESKSTFYVFIRANVLRHGGFEDLKYLSETDVAKAGVDDGWPEVKPRVIR